VVLTIIIGGFTKRPNFPVVQPMKILVPVKRTVDAYVKVRVLADHSGVDLSNTKMALNPFCEIAVEEAVRLKEKGIATEVIAISIGADKVQEQLRTAMALGADRCIHVPAADHLEPINIAKLLQAVVARENPGLVILGKQAIDSDDNQVGQMLAALCGLPQATFASSLEFAENSVMVSREIDGGEQVLRLQLPAVITTDLRLNEPRYAKLPDIMKAKKKPVEQITPEQLGVELKSHVLVLNTSEPPARKAGIRVSSVAELVDKLRNEARVLG
jgi:electron transfer flavoprotein beta subunit